jgi:hypothetical protein
MIKMSSLKNEIMSFAGVWMELEIIMLSEVSQAQKERFHPTAETRPKKQSRDCRRRTIQGRISEWEEGEEKG